MVSRWTRLQYRHFPVWIASEAWVLNQYNNWMSLVLLMILMHVCDSWSDSSRMYQSSFRMDQRQKSISSNLNPKHDKRMRKHMIAIIRVLSKENIRSPDLLLIEPVDALGLAFTDCISHSVSRNHSSLSRWSRWIRHSKQHNSSVVNVSTHSMRYVKNKWKW